LPGADRIDNARQYLQRLRSDFSLYVQNSYPCGFIVGSNLVFGEKVPYEKPLRLISFFINLSF